ncbi:CD225/dispanin family protein [Sphingobacterium sp. Mn56C]|uniref:CD225/dispanin family protein n=1 Tax=Sphingobacterium sp. Mn56C TaxID=3395261 RepID=UPI003BE0C4A5
MKQYHYSDGQRSFGPTSLEDLRTLAIKPDTLIWTAELVNWTQAQHVPELADLFANTEASTADSNVPPLSGSYVPPAQPTHYQQSAINKERPKTYLVASILTTIFFFWPLGIPSIVYASRVERKFNMGDIQGAYSDSANAKKWILINVIVTLLFYLVIFSIFGLTIFSAIQQNSNFAL